MQPAADERKNRQSIVCIYKVRVFGNVYLYHYRPLLFFRRSRNRPPDTTHFTRSYWESLFGSRKIETDFCMPYSVQIIKNDERIPGTAFT